MVKFKLTVNSQYLASIMVSCLLKSSIPDDTLCVCVDLYVCHEITLVKDV